MKTWINLRDIDIHTNLAGCEIRNVQTKEQGMVTLCHPAKCGARFVKYKLPNVDELETIHDNSYGQTSFLEVDMELYTQERHCICTPEERAFLNNHSQQCPNCGGIMIKTKLTGLFPVNGWQCTKCYHEC